MATTLLALGSGGASAENYPRVSAAEGTVVAHKLGEEAKFVDLPAWRAVDVDQNLLAGDTLRTNASGSLSIRFADKTLVRMGRNTTLLVKAINAVEKSVLSLEEGSVWARAVRGGSQLQIDTPAAAAAIRGTDWTLTVNGNHTTLTVLEGAVELKNAQGTVLVSQGEGATATLGQAPRKYTLVNLREREQQLFYTELRGVFSSLPAGSLRGPRLRAERRRIVTIPPQARTTDDWLTLAETAVSLTGRAQAREALSHVTAKLGSRDAARAKLVEAMLAGQELRYSDAARLFAEALPGLPRDRKATAAYGLWFARSLGQPDRAFTPPADAAYAGDPAAWIARAQAVAHINGQAQAIEVVTEAEKRFPDDARFPAMRASLAFELDRREEAKQALERARHLDPDDPSYLLVSAQFKTSIFSDLDGALADLQHAAAIAPGNDGIWNEIGIVQSDRNAKVEADTAHRRAIGLNPENAVLHANYARFLMDNDQLAAAKREIDLAETLDAHSYAVLASKGRYLLRIGKAADGEKALLEASALNPTYGDALIGLAIAAYQQDAGDETNQALDNADRFDRDNPSIPLIRAGIALDQFQADAAILDAREALRRRLKRGGYYSGYDANRQASSFLGVTLENLGMDEWGQYYADRAYDPFKSSSYIDEAAKGRLSPFVDLPPTALDRFPGGTTSTSSQLQGLLFDPLSVASEMKRNSLERRNFFEAALGGSVLDQGNGLDPDGNLLLQGTSYSSIPVSYYIQGETSRSKGLRDNDADNLDGGLFQLGLRPTLTDSIVLFGNKYRHNEGYPEPLFAPSEINQAQTDNTTLGGAWSHEIAERNTLQMFAVSSQTDTRRDFVFNTSAVRLGFLSFDPDPRRRLMSGVGEPSFDSLSAFDPAGSHLKVITKDGIVHEKATDRYFAFGLNHMLGVGPVTFRYGAEATWYEGRVSQMLVPFDGSGPQYIGPFDSNTFAARSYVDAIYDVSLDLKFEAGAYYTRINGDHGKWGPVDPRLGVAWSPTEGQWLRAYFRQDTQMPSTYTLSPISTIGLMQMDLPSYWSGQTRTAALRWDAEWNERFFTSAEYQHVTFNGLALSAIDVFAYNYFPTTQGEIDRLNLSANYWIGNGLGAFGSFTLYHSRDLTPGWDDSLSVPLIPDYVAQVGLKYVHPSRITAAVAQNFIGQRVGALDPPSVYKLGRYATTDAALTWTSENRTVDWSLSVTNIFDQHTQTAYEVPAPGRTFRAAFTARF